MIGTAGASLPGIRKVSSLSVIHYETLGEHQVHTSGSDRACCDFRGEERRREGRSVMACLQRGGNTTKATSGGHTYPEALVGQPAYGKEAGTN